MKNNLFNIVYKCLLDDTDFATSLLMTSQNVTTNNRLTAYQLKKRPSSDNYISTKENAIEEIERLRKLMITDNDTFINEASAKLKFKGLLEITRKYAPDKYDTVERWIEEGANWADFFSNCVPFRVNVNEIEKRETVKQQGRPQRNKYIATLLYNDTVVQIDFKPLELALYLYFINNKYNAADNLSVAHIKENIDVIYKLIAEKSYQNDSNFEKRINDVNSKIIDAISKFDFVNDGNIEDIAQWYTINTTKDETKLYLLSLPKECISLPPELKKDSR